MKFAASKYHPGILNRLLVLYAQFTPAKEISSTLKAEFGVEVPIGYIKSYVLRPGTAVNTKMLALRETDRKSVV